MSINYIEIDEQLNQTLIILKEVKNKNLSKKDSISLVNELSIINDQLIISLRENPNNQDIFNRLKLSKSLMGNINHYLAKNYSDSIKDFLKYTKEAENSYIIISSYGKLLENEQNENNSNLKALYNLIYEFFNSKAQNDPNLTESNKAAFASHIRTKYTLIEIDPNISFSEKERFLKDKIRDFTIADKLTPYDSYFKKELYKTYINLGQVQSQMAEISQYAHDRLKFSDPNNAKKEADKCLALQKDSAESSEKAKEYKKFSPKKRDKSQAPTDSGLDENFRSKFLQTAYKSRSNPPSFSVTTPVKILSFTQLILDNLKIRGIDANQR